MGNTNTNSKRNERPYSIDVYGGLDRRGESPRGDDQRSMDIPSGGKRRPVLCYQSSSDYGSEDVNDDFKNHLNTAHHGISDQLLPTVFKWDGGGKEVYITGTFSEWKPLRMVQSQGDFVTVVDIPEGEHKYKFVVDGVEMVDKNVALDESQVNNVLNVKKSDFEVFEALEMDLASNSNQANTNQALSGSPPGSYTQEIPTHFSQHDSGTNTGSGGHAGPPILPPHLLQAILNVPVHFNEPTLLPQPNHTVINHLYALSIKDSVMVLSAINRYRKKTVTTLLYKPC